MVASETRTTGQGLMKDLAKHRWVPCLWQPSAPPAVLGGEGRRGLGVRHGLEVSPLPLQILSSSSLELPAELRGFCWTDACFTSARGSFGEINARKLLHLETFPGVH